MKRLVWITILILAVGCSGQERAQRSEDDGEGSPTAEPSRKEWEAARAEESRRLRADALTDPPVDARAQWELGMNYYVGRGLEPDHAKAREWFRKAADQGEGVSQMYLGVLHLEGGAVPQSNVQAYMWFSLSAEQEVLPARRRLDDLVERMTPAEIAEAEKLAENWKPAAWTGPRPKK